MVRVLRSRELDERGEKGREGRLRRLVSGVEVLD